MRKKENKTLGVGEGLNFNVEDEIPEAPAVSEAPQIYEVPQTQKLATQRDPAPSEQLKERKPLEMGQTQGKKGQKLTRMSISFSDRNVEYLKVESRRRGKHVTTFINEIIDFYRSSPEGKAFIKEWDD